MPPISNPISRLATLDEKYSSRSSRSAAEIEKLRGMAGRGGARRAPGPPQGYNNEREGLEDVKRSVMSEQYMRQMPRRWTKGDTYAPRDLGPVEQFRWSVKKAKRVDMMDALAFNPLDNYRNFAMISEFITPMGRIMHSNQTGLRPANHRKMAKAIRRAIGMGIHPSVHMHPELILLANRKKDKGPLDLGLSTVGGRTGI